MPLETGSEIVSHHFFRKQNYITAARNLYWTSVQWQWRFENL